MWLHERGLVLMGQEGEVGATRRVRGGSQVKFLVTAIWAMY
jgi:hypothetical protein